MSRVLVFGTFDGLHPGHEFFFEQARRRGGELFVVVARDQTVQDVKGRLPVRDEQERLRAVQKHFFVEEAFLGGLGDKYAVIEELVPDVIVLGYDQEAYTQRLEDELMRRGLRCVVIREVQSLAPHKFKSSLLR